jgi:hypothetical protein
MVRKQVLITAEQNRRLKALAACAGVSEGELVRAGLDAALRKLESEEENWKTAWRQAKGIWADRSDIDEIMAKRREARRRRREKMNALMRAGRE